MATNTIDIAALNLAWNNAEPQAATITDAQLQQMGIQSTYAGFKALHLWSDGDYVYETCWHTKKALGLSRQPTLGAQQ